MTDSNRNGDNMVDTEIIDSEQLNGTMNTVGDRMSEINSNFKRMGSIELV